jgi:peptidoglycan/LPS O-acetylase OafA/YrhL
VIPQQEEMAAAAGAAGARPKATRPPLGALTGLRFIAAFGVVLYHFVRFDDGPAATLNRLFQNSHVAVQFFFVLSGFILAYNYLDRGRSLDRGRFWAARFARIYAVYITAMIISAPFFWRELRVVHGYDGATAVRHLLAVAPMVTTMSQSFFPVVEVVAEWNTPAWSLSCEAFFYASFPFLAMYLSGLGLRASVAALVAIWVAGIALISWVEPLLPAQGTFAGITGKLNWELHPIPNFATFLSGIVWGRVFLLTRHRDDWGKAAGWLSSMLFFVVVWYLATHRGGGPGDVALRLSHPLFGLLIYTLAWQRGPVARLLSIPLVVLLGEASYALYMYHYPVWAYFQQLWSKLLHLPVGLAFNATYLVVVLVASLLVYRLIERPARQWVTGRIDARARRAAAPARPVTDNA